MCVCTCACVCGIQWYALVTSSDKFDSANSLHPPYFEAVPITHVKPGNFLGYPYFSWMLTGVTLKMGTGVKELAVRPLINAHEPCDI